ncbi:MAG: class I SAM-dependent methyltransferase, partial [Ardenticatenaceae bacterium]
DHSGTALKQAMENLKDARNAAVQFVQSRVEQLSEAINKNTADTIFFCNAIHYVPDKDALLAEISRSIKPGGKFVFITSFFEGSHPPETLLFYRKWMFKAVRILRREYGLSLVRSEKVEARKHLTPGQYTILLENNGFLVARQEIDKVMVPIDGWLDISEFEDFIEGTMPGVPLDKASAALKQGIHETFDELELEFVPRNWLDVVAVKA